MWEGLRVPRHPRLTPHPDRRQLRCPHGVNSRLTNHRPTRPEDLSQTTTRAPAPRERAQANALPKGGRVGTGQKNNYLLNDSAFSRRPGDLAVPTRPPGISSGRVRTGGQKLASYAYLDPSQDGSGRVGTGQFWCDLLQPSSPSQDGSGRVGTGRIWCDFLQSSLRLDRLYDYSLASRYVPLRTTAFDPSRGRAPDCTRGSLALGVRGGYADRLLARGRDVVGDRSSGAVGYGPAGVLSPLWC
jgi:hypothetical protein